jgi:hypothetical protein
MPSTKALRSISAPPTRLASYADDRGVRTKEFVDDVNRLRDREIGVQAALTELEPP